MDELTGLSEELEAILEALRPEVAARFISDTEALCRVGEFAVALENLCDNLHETKRPIAAALKRRIAAFARSVGVGECYWRWLLGVDADPQDWRAASELLELLGASEDDPRVKAMSCVFGEQHDEVSGMKYLESEERGLSAMLEDGIVSALFFHGEGKDGFAEFSGPLIEGLSFSSTAQEVRAVLGCPRPQRFEGVPGTARMEQFFIAGNLLASFDYRADGALLMLTIEAAPPSGR